VQASVIATLTPVAISLLSRKKDESKGPGPPDAMG
jgi:hypothetical protein